MLDSCPIINRHQTWKEKPHDSLGKQASCFSPGPVRRNIFHPFGLPAAGREEWGGGGDEKETGLQQTHQSQTFQMLELFRGQTSLLQNKHQKMSSAIASGTKAGGGSK
uniref:Uncharacterized protein n=1 Tax=Sphaerodactylus townsendi TaxID=933632 RepID=A0ACB8EV27_9SAUR